MNKKTKTTETLKSLNKDKLRHAATTTIPVLLEELRSGIGGLDETNIAANRLRYGSNKVTHEKQKPLYKKIAEAFINPFTAILFFLAIVSTFTDIILPLKQGTEIAPLTVVIILTMVCISGSLRFIQEMRSGNAAEKLLAMITTTCTVARKVTGKQEIPLEDVVVGDIVYLSAGDMIPADLRIIEAKDLFISQSALTGESDPQEKKPQVVMDCQDSLTEYPNLAFMGTNVISGSATALVVATGDHSMFGSMARAVAGEAAETSFTQGVNSVSWVLIRFMLVMVPVVFFINGITKGDWLDAFLFAISIAVGLTPEMLPMIVTTCLAKGAVSMSKKKTIVKNLNSIQNFGAIDVLCTDKTGTLTQDRVVLEYHMDVHGKDNIRVLRHAYLNSYFQTGYKNLMDLAIMCRTEEKEAENPSLVALSKAYRKVDEIPFDFTRRRLSVVVEDQNGKAQMITKGAVEETLSICAFAEYDGKIEALTHDMREKILKTVDQFNRDGMRVIAVAQK
ncbi:MAG: HAD-IC family P-type ATPase, partial [Evtepia sp.]